MRRRARGYVLAEALVSAAIASLAGGLSVMLLVWAAASVDRSQSSVGAMRVLSRLYEESRLLTADDLDRPAGGVLGRYQWARSPSQSLDPQNDASPTPVRFTAQWTSGGRLERRTMLAIVRPAAPAPTPPGAPP